MLALVLSLAISQTPAERAVLGASGPERPHVVLLAGDEEYRSEEALPQLAKILSLRHGFRCTVLFSLNDKGEIDPDVQTHQPGLEALARADVVLLALRFRRWPEGQMRHFDAYLKSGKPIIALRTSTHAFDYTDGPFERYGWRSKTWPGGFGKQVLGETWLSHWGIHGRQATRGIPNPAAAGNPLLNGVEGVFGTTDVYEAHPPADAKVLLFGEVVEGMSPSDPAARGRKVTVHGVERGLNEPMMPIAWTRLYRNEAGRTIRVYVCTMGAATDFQNEGLRRMAVNFVLAAAGRPVPPRADVTPVGEYRPSPFGFGGFKKGVKPGYGKD
jgi:hypothetical protein